MAKVWEFRKDYIGLSTDEKPQEAVDGNTFYEVDTSNFYIMYNGTWYLQEA